MLEHVRKDHVLDDIMRREHIKAPELISAIVVCRLSSLRTALIRHSLHAGNSNFHSHLQSRDDPLGEKDGSINSNPEFLVCLCLLLTIHSSFYPSSPPLSLSLPPFPVLGV
jgi:hypothetical protein